jgi:hypothetical protein
MLTRKSAANINLGDIDVAAPVAQTLSVQSVIAGTTNLSGSNFTIAGSRGTGTGAGGSIIFQTAPAGSSGTAQNPLSSSIVIDGQGVLNIPAAPTANTTGMLRIVHEQTGQLRPGIYATSYGDMSLATYGNGGPSNIGCMYSKFIFSRRGLVVGTSGAFAYDPTANGQIGDALYFGNGASTIDISLGREAANTLALRNGLSAQVFRLYNTFTDASNYERGFIGWSSSVLSIGTEQAGTGSARNMQVISSGRLILRAGVSQSLRLGAGGNDRWDISSDGNLVAIADNTYDIGASGATRPRIIYVGTDVIPGRGIYFSAAGAHIRNPGNGILTFYNSSVDNFDRVQLGGTTNLFPAIKRNGAGIQIRLADDSGNAALETSTLTVVGSASVSGHFSATTKSFLIPHPTKPSKQLQYACLEGPENGVYIRGKTNESVIILPDYWQELVDEDSVTVTVTPIGKFQQLFVASQTSESVEIGNVDGFYNYVIYGERKDVDKLQTEI